MYIVFLCFSLRPLLTTTESTKSVWSSLSIYNIFLFYVDIVSLFFRSLK
jgi:hypothetical protein